jgi:site-specific DNA-methyltransferase (adenine-specific)
MKPYYEDEFITLYNNNCLSDPTWVSQADVMVTDPPYGTGQTGYGRAGREIANDLDTKVRDEALQLWQDKPYAMFASGKMPSPSFAWDHQLVWDKAVAGMGGKVRYQHELLYVYKYGQIGNGFSVIRVSKELSLTRLHPHAKPSSLMAMIVGAAPDGVIIDPFAGIGGTLIAAKQLGRKVIGYELNIEYCEVIANRAAQEVLI